jgi:hypothetical protein
MHTLLDLMSVLLSLLLTLRTLTRSRVALQLEVLTLRHQLEVLQRTGPRRVRLAKTDRWLWQRAIRPSQRRMTMAKASSFWLVATLSHHGRPFQLQSINSRSN